MLVNNSYSKLMALFESVNNDEKMVIMQQATTTLSPFTRNLDATILKNMMDPTTGLPYEGGIIVEGEFASMDVLNNNNRYYSETNYLEFVEILKHQIFGPRGLYGELEHPKSYAVDYNNVSHKILDIWYDKDKRKVFGVVLILATPNGLKAQQIVKSGGKLAISARGGGAEHKNPDGTITAQLRLLTTFDLVCHPGFESAILDHTTLGSLYENNAVCIYERDMPKLANLYENYNNLAFNNSFINWLGESQDIAQSQQQKQQQKLESQEAPKEEEIEEELSSAVNRLDEQLTEADYKQLAFFGQSSVALKKLRK